MATLSIPEFYTNKSIFITGGSGFIGKVLVEKLLRSCPALKTIYLLIRGKKGKSLDERIHTITDLPLFDVLKQQDPEGLKKIQLIEGDATELGLGLSPDNTQLLIDEVNIVFHAAASVRFDDPLTDAIILNTRGTREVVKLALQMKKIDVFLHISTTFCHIDKPVIGEELYPAPVDWETAIEVAEKIDRQTLDVLTPKYINPFPNTYTFTKSLSEHVVYDLCKGKVPSVIMRPSIVVSTVDEPIEGWIDNFNGPLGMFVAGGKGIIRTFHGNPDVVGDCIPVDMFLKSLIISSWKHATCQDMDKLTPGFYNASQGGINPLTMGEMIEMGKKLSQEVPFDTILWYPDFNILTRCYYYHFIKLVFYQILPAIVIDMVLSILRRKPMLLKIQRRIYVANVALYTFISNQWTFVNTKSVQLEDQLLASDFDSFSYGVDRFDIYQYYRKAYIGGKKYLVKEYGGYQTARKNLYRMKVLYYGFNFLWYLGLLWLVFIKVDIVSIVVDKLNDCYYFLTVE